MLSTAVRATQWASAGAFVLLGLMLARDWLRGRAEGQRHLVEATLLIAAVSLLGRLNDVTGYRFEVLGDVSLIGFVASGFLFLLFRDSFVPLSPRARWVSAAICGAVAVAAVAARFPGGTHPSYTTAQMVVLGALIIVWCACVIEPCVRLWAASRDKPAVQRKWLRALSAGFLGIAVVLLVAVGAISTNYSDAVQLGLGLAVVALIPLLYASFVPPAWLRRLWSESEQQQFDTAIGDLVLYAEDRVVLAQRALDWAIRLVGGHAGCIALSPEQVVAVQGIGPQQASQLVTEIGLSGGPQLLDSTSSSEPAIAIPLHVADGPGALVVLGGPFTPLFDRGEVDRLAGYAVLFTAALERVRLRELLASRTEERELLLSALSDLDEGLVITADGRPRYVNEAYTRLTGYTSEDLLALGHLIEICAPEDRERVTAYTEAQLAGESVPRTIEAAIVTKDGGQVPIEVSGKPLGDPATRQFVAIVRDVSERHRARMALELRATELARSNAALEEFAFIASHDLQEPLRMVTSYLDLIVARYRDQLDADAHEFIGYALDGASRMGSLIEGLLSYSRAGGQGNMELTDSNEAVRQALVNLQATIASTGARITCAKLPAVIGDQRQLVQLFQNLIGNGIKFHTEAVPEVQVGCERGEDGWVFSVRDNGIGIDPRHQDRIFMIFRRLHAHHDYPGTGIGLSICRKIVESHGGRIWVDSVPGVGSVFYVSLPDPLQSLSRALEKSPAAAR
jgi:PAS domain S-box-containing protein